MRKIIFISLILLISISVNSQIYKKHKNNHLKFYGTLDFRNVQIENNPFETYGIKIGMGNKKLRFGIAYHIFHKNLFSVFNEDDFFEAPTVLHHQTKYYTVSLFTEIIIHQSPRWELLAPLHLGLGEMKLDANKAEVTHLHVVDHELDYMKKTELVESAVISLKANYRIVKWVGLTSGFGYNFAFTDDKYIKTTFSSFFYSFGVKLFFDEFGKMFKSKEYREKYLWEPNFVKDYE